MGIEEVIIEMARQEGRREGELKGRLEAKLEANCFYVKNLLTSTDLSVEKIASLVGVSQDFVLEEKRKLHL